MKKKIETVEKFIKNKIPKKYNNVNNYKNFFEFGMNFF